jgi:glutathione-regulated potassium-efflux system ancillary protein KefG
MPRILILFAHPALEKSRVHWKMIRHIKRLPNVTFHDLYQVYPDMDIDTEFEKKLLLQHDIIVMQHPFYWYSAPALIKQWQDLVLEHGWAYGSGGVALANKKIFNVITCGGPREFYQKKGRNRFTINEMLVPFNQTAFLCHMIYMPPFVVHGTHNLSDTDIELHAVQYEELLIAIQSGRITENEWQHAEYLNDLVPIPSIIQS